MAGPSGLNDSAATAEPSSAKAGPAEPPHDRRIFLHEIPDKAATPILDHREDWPLVEAGAVKPIVHAALPLAEAGEGQRVMEASEHLGKILLLP